jgi:hypothetical protein
MAQPHITQPNPTRLAPREWAFLAAVILAWGALAVALGKETGWDFRNYHWYDAYAFLNGRMGFDVAVAHHATYYNPLLDVPFYLLAGVASWLALFSLGAVQGLNIVPLYLIARASLSRDPQFVGALLALICITGSTVLSLTGVTSHDTVLSVLVLSGLAVLIVRRERLSLPAIMIAAALVGAAAGFKLVEMPFAVGFAAALLVIPGTMKQILQRVGAGAAGGLLGIALTGGYWYATLWHQTGNPLFPYFNDILGSPLALDASYRDTRFLPANAWDALTFPFRFSFNYHVADDTAFQNLRVLAAYIAVPAAAIFWTFGKRARDAIVDPAAARILFAFAAAAYVAWIAVFGIYRYIVALEMLAPLLIVAAIGLLPVASRARLAAIAMVLAATAVLAGYSTILRGGHDDPYVRVQYPAIAHPGSSMILMTGYEPMGYVVPSLPPQIPIVRIDGYLAGPEDGSALTARMKARVAAHRGDLFLLFAQHEAQRAAYAVQAYGLAIAASECGNVATNLGGRLRFCPLIRTALHD